MIFAGCSGQKPLSDRFEEETVKKTAEEIIELVHEGDYEKIIEEYESAKLVTVLAEEDLRNAVQPVMEELGEPEKIERTVVTGNENPETKEEYATAVSIVSYENGKAQYTITFNQAMKMEGFTLNKGRKEWLCWDGLFSLFCVMGVLFWTGKGGWLIAGYNTASAEGKRKI